MKKIMESLCTAADGMQVSEVELVYKSKVKASERPQVSTSKEVYELFKQYWDENRIEFVEQFKILLLNRTNKVLGIYEISTGGLSGTVADPKVVFIAALKAAASHIILAHNHPSGAPRKRIGVIHKTFMSMFGVNIVDREAGTWIKTTMFLKPSPNVVNGCPTIQRTAIQSNTMATKETVDRCPAGWNTRLKLGIECSYRKYFTDGSTNPHRDRTGTTPYYFVPVPDSGRENDSCKGYRQCLRYYDDDTDVNLGTILTSLITRVGLVCDYKVKMGRSFRSSLRQGRPVTLAKGNSQRQCNHHFVN